MIRTLLISLAASATFVAASPQPKPFRRPLVFEPNRGQAPDEARWIAHGQDYDLLFTSEGLKMFLAGKSAANPSGAFPIRKYTAMRFKLRGSRPWNVVSGSEPTGGASNYLLGRNVNPLTGIPQYARLRVADVYPGIDVIFYDNSGSLEYDFEVRPHADPAQIRMAFEGNRGLRVDHQSGDLVLTAPDGAELRQHAPKMYQQAGDRRVDVPGEYRLVGRGQAAFSLTSYDRHRTLIIDPTLQVTKFLGDYSAGSAMAIGPDGNLYITGLALSNFPTTNGSKYTDGVDNTFWGNFWKTFGNGEYPQYPGIPNAVVTKLSPQGAVLFSTYTEIGTANAIAVDSTGVVITGWRTYDQHDSVTSPTGLFVKKLSLTGSQIYDVMGIGSAYDKGMAVALDSQHNAWVAAQANEFQNHPILQNALALRVSPQGAITDQQILGGAGLDVPFGVAVDGDDNPWFTGQACSGDFPATPGLDFRGGAACGIFVMKLIHQPGNASVQFATVFGGSATDNGNAIAVNANREAFVTGTTSAPAFYTSPGAYQRQATGNLAQGFITQIDSSGHFLHSTLLGSSSGATEFHSIALNGAGEVYVGGSTTASTFPGNGPVTLDPTTAGILAKLSSDLSSLIYARQEGTTVNAIALFEALPAVTPTQVYSTGGDDFNHANQSRMFFDKVMDDQQFNHLQNFWIQDRFINLESGSPGAGQIGPDWWSADWYFDLPPGTDASGHTFFIRNRWTNQYLNMQNGTLITTTQPGFWNASEWIFEPINGTNLYRLRNALVTDWCLNIQSGTLTATPVQPGWWSSWWIIGRGD